jgi:hypothetical protein
MHLHPRDSIIIEINTNVRTFAEKEWPKHTNTYVFLAPSARNLHGGIYFYYMFIIKLSKKWTKNFLCAGLYLYDKALSGFVFCFFSLINKWKLVYLSLLCVIKYAADEWINIVILDCDARWVGIKQKNIILLARSRYFIDFWSGKFETLSKHTKF